MRIIKADEIITKKYSIIDNEVIEEEHGDYFSNEVAKQVAEKGKSKELIEFDQSLLEKEAIRFCRTEYKILLMQSRMSRAFEVPKKYFELFRLDVCGGITGLLRSSFLPEGEDKELYYSFNTANDIYELCIDFYDNPLNDEPSVQEFYRNEIIEVEQKIAALKQYDEEIFEREIQAYEIIANSSFHDEYNLLLKGIADYRTQNKKLNEDLQTNRENIADLMKKLKVALNRVEQLQMPRTFLEKLKYLFRSKEKYLLK